MSKNCRNLRDFAPGESDPSRGVSNYLTALSVKWGISQLKIQNEKFKIGRSATVQRGRARLSQRAAWWVDTAMEEKPPETNCTYCHERTQSFNK
jgi:hypothetical protein